MDAQALRRKLRYGRQRTERVLKRIGAGLVAYATWPVWRNTRALFVLSTGRTGTTTLARLLNLSSEIEAFHQPQPELLKARQAARWEIHAEPGKYRHIFVRARGTPLFQAVRKGRMYAETSARLTFFAPVIADLLPKARFLFIHRDPVGLIRSGMKRGWYVDHPADYARVRPVKGEPFFDRWETMSPFEKVCWYWNVYNDFALRFCQHVDSSRVLIVQASNLFDGTAVPEIFDLLDCRKPADKDIDRVLKKKLNAQQEGSFPEAEEWSPSMHDTLWSVAGDTMEQLGYSAEDYANQG
jgi:hypothetical protein